MLIPVLEVQQGNNIHSTLLDFAEDNSIDIVIVGGTLFAVLDNTAALSNILQVLQRVMGARLSICAIDTNIMAVSSSKSKASRGSSGGNHKASSPFHVH